MSHWDRLIELSGGGQISYQEPALDTLDEVWFFQSTNHLLIWRAGGLVAERRDLGERPPPLTGRDTRYHLRRQLVVDVEYRGETIILRRGLLNGPLVTCQVAAREVPGLLERYHRLGFRGDPWNAVGGRSTTREYRRDWDTWTIRVRRTTVVECLRRRDGGYVPTVPSTAADPGSALALAERRVAEQEAAGFALYRIELSGRSPESEPELPSPVAGPTDAWAAVDAAIELLTGLHERFPVGHLIAELLVLPADLTRLTDCGCSPDFFARMHHERLGRWRTATPGRPVPGESSWDYFARVYGSVTWILHHQASDGLNMFHCGNTAGGGWSCLEIDAAGTYDPASLAIELDEPELAELFVFHGGWHHGPSYAFDRRVRSAAGEHPIVDSDESIQELPPASDPADVVPFGHWLHERVVRLAAQVSVALDEIQ